MATTLRDRVQLLNTYTVCSKCGTRFPVQLRNVRGPTPDKDKVYNQPQCSLCRSGKGK